ncbi:MAG: CPBP family intramembrane metalloprotease [Eubacteriales bacterium]|nr:CPBP family intramembrane metalloprotease [Eubacteriales bacterium]
MGIHFLIAQILGGALMLFLMGRAGNGQDAYYDNAIWLTGVTGICTMIPALFFFRRDYAARKSTGVIPKNGQQHISAGEGIWLFFTGAALAQFGNILMAFLMLFFDSSEYQETMSMLTDGKSLAMMIFWMGIVAPAAEEMVFRWLIYLRLRDYTRMLWAAVISGAIFGIYHGNLVQAIYAGILGTVFAYILEMTGNLMSSVLLHIGANVWSLIYPEIAVRLLDTSAQFLILAWIGLLLLILVTGLLYFTEKGRKRGKRSI